MNDHKKEDITGRKNFLRNLLFSWGGYLVNVISGFIMPRLISDHLGQATLGIWDFSWSLVSYFGLVQLGLGGSVNRYVARYRAVSDIKNLSISVSTIGLFLKVSGISVIIISFITSYFFLPFFTTKFDQEMESCQIVILCLGCEIGVSLIFAVYTGILTGCHRWDFHNSISAATYFITTAGMITAILFEASLPTLALIHFITAAIGDLFRSKLAILFCPELNFDYRLANWKTWFEQARFSAKSLIPQISGLLSNQALSILITVSLGPTMLAVFSRPRSLLGSIQVFAAKFGNILVPAVSSLQAKSDILTLHKTLKESTTLVSALFLPVIIVISVFGDYIISFWMGQNFVTKNLLSVLSIGTFSNAAQEPIWSILVGLNIHGRLALFKLIISIISISILSYVLLIAKCSLVIAAACFVIPQVITDLIYLPYYACKRLNISRGEFYSYFLFKPLFCNIGFYILLNYSKSLIPISIAYSLLVLFSGFILLLCSYWYIIFPCKFKLFLLNLLCFKNPSN